jgi:hypothetical protein
VIITVIRVRVVEAALDEVIGVFSVRHRLVAAVGTVHVLAAVMRAIAGVRELLVNGKRMLVYVVTVRLVQVAVMDEVNVAVVDDRRVAAAGAVDVVVIFVRMHL